MQIFFEDFTVDAVCITLPLCIKVLRLWAPRDELEDCPFCYLYDKNYASKYITFITSRLAPGLTSRPGDSPPCAMRSFPQSDK